MQIHWHEGLFLQPQHLQRMQQDYQDLLDHDRRLHWLHPRQADLHYFRVLRSENSRIWHQIQAEKFASSLGRATMRATSKSAFT